MQKPRSNHRAGPTRKGPQSGRIVVAIDDADATAFDRANAAFIREATASKEKAVKALQASGYLTASGSVAKRYR